MLLFVLSLCGLASAMSGRIVDPVVIDIAEEFGSPVGAVALLSTAYALPFALSQPFLGPLGDLLPKARIVKVAIVLLAFLLGFAALAFSLPYLFAARRYHLTALFNPLVGRVLIPYLSMEILFPHTPPALRRRSPSPRHVLGD